MLFSFVVSTEGGVENFLEKVRINNSGSIPWLQGLQSFPQLQFAPKHSKSTPKPPNNAQRELLPSNCNQFGWETTTAFNGQNSVP